MELVTVIPSLITGLITGLIALGGVVYTQRQAAAREAEKWARDQSQSAAEHERQRRLWAKDHRYKAHLSFIAEHRRLQHWMAIYTRVGIPGTETPQPDWTKDLFTKLLDVELFASAEAAVAARRLAGATTKLRDGTVGAMMEADEAFFAYRKLVQRDLDLDETELPSWRDEIQMPTQE
ncbi:hypothetical protein [uncultured Arthrobacter sp.]|uniref:hypothetical protein n=1 Tax=uncultured Arthrobacter sp. TaxID=114050 RepID=UPI0028D4C838|nr:hypothetical protein [uncultured Arthrobacter sp.]